ncbi:3'-5' exonuclease [Lysinibacillus agricola]|uniref:3'-5' exonuclease n=1 Tax=Lysinibacillus agricola TaxID=2590012 RepID=A0ABX7AXZ9_9BACI|nr:MULTISPECIES: 3'-5' exonuclease [Lysinibacillus]QQP14669.1 3'-5' exonuclease [Lysinibacillus agricola]
MNWLKKLFSKKQPIINKSVEKQEPKEEIKVQEENELGSIKLRMNEPSTLTLRAEFNEPKRINDSKEYLKYTKTRKFVVDFTVLDFETTGLDPEESSIIQIAAVKYRNFEKVDEFFTYINPIENIPAKITRITGITNEDVEDAPYIFDKIYELVEFLEGETIVAHNAPFDMKFLLTNINNMKKLSYVKYRVIDTLSLSRKYIDFTKNHKLATLKSFLKLNHLKSHDALHDCYVTAELYKYCYEENLVKN